MLLPMGWCRMVTCLWCVRWAKILSDRNFSLFGYHVVPLMNAALCNGVSCRRLHLPVSCIQSDKLGSAHVRCVPWEGYHPPRSCCWLLST